jgi:hypothetical protein
MVGSASASGGTFTVAGGGFLIGSATTDRFRYVYQTLTGDGSMTVRIANRTISVPAVNGALAGIMVRETNGVDSKYAMVALRSNGSSTVRFMRRTATGAISENTSIPSQIFPNCYFRIERVGNTFTLRSSADGITWANSANYTVTMASNVNIGFIVCSDSDTSLDTAEFQNVTVVP